MKKLLFLYPTREYMKVLDREDIIKKLNNTIDKRYREKGYEINYLVFPDKEVTNLNVYNNDKVLKTDITFEQHITPIKKDTYLYPDNRHIEKVLGEVKELVVCGFHAQDCVKRVATHFYNLGIDTLVDIELTELFRILGFRYYFNDENYNLANIIEYSEAEAAHLYGGFTSLFDSKNMYTEPYYKKDTFIPTITKEIIIDMMEEKEIGRSR